MNARRFDALIQRWRTVASGLPDPRTGDNSQFEMADIALSAFAVFFTQCPSFLSFQQNMAQAQGRNNARSLFQVGRIPSDNHIRQTLDPVEPRHLFSLFDDLHQAFQEAGLLQAMRAVNDTRLIALDATWYFSSQSKNIHCPNCSCILSSWIEGLRANGQLHALKLKLKGKSNRWEHHRYRWANGVPLTDSDDALKVNWCEVTISSADGAVRYHNGFITDWNITAENVAGLIAAGRARWKIENESNNVLKNRGYHLEHNFGHGKEHLASLLMTMNLLAFGLHTLLDLTDESYHLIRSTVGARRKFFAHLEALTTYLYFETWERLMDFMMRGLEIGPYAAPKH